MRSDREKTGLSLRWQICLLTGITLAVSLVCMGALAFRNSSALATRLTLDTLLAETNASTTAIEELLRHTRVDAVINADFPAVAALVRTWDHQGVDPEQPGT